MMHKDVDMIIDKVLGTTSEGFAAEEKETYEKPVLEVVKFMFENDITMGSFETGKGDDNEYEDEDWWA